MRLFGFGDDPMINTERVKLMTEMQTFVDLQGEESRPMYEYFRTDYVAKQLLLSILSGTTVFLLACFLVFTEDIEGLLLSVDFENLGATVTPLISRYIIFMVIYLVATLLIYGLRYGRGRKKIKKYYAQLTALEKQYKEEAKQTKPMGGTE